MGETIKIRETIQDFLKGKDKEECLKKAYYKNQEQFKLLVYGFCEFLVKKYTSYRDDDLEECRSETYLYVLNKLSEDGREYNRKRGNFLTFIYYYIRNGISAYVYKKTRHGKFEIPVEAFPLDVSKSQSRVLFDDDFGETLKKFVGKKEVDELKENMRQTLEYGKVEDKEYSAMECAYLWKVFREHQYSDI